MALPEDAWRPVWVRGGKFEDATWIGKDILAWCSGMHIVFYNVDQHRVSLRWCSKMEYGDGVSCLSGHPTIRAFAFSEKTCVNPKIYVLSYPSMNRISECINESQSPYLATAFLSAEHFVSLSSHPTFSLFVWFWRTGEKLATINTPIRDIDAQVIRVSHSKPALIAQLGRRSRKLLVWETSLTGKTVLTTNHEITLPGGALPFDMDWSFEAHNPQLAIVDEFANVYTANYNGSAVSQSVLTLRCGICPDWEAPLIRCFRDGIILRTTFCQIRFYKKEPRNSLWRKQWYVKSTLKPTIVSVHPAKTDKLFYHTHEGYLVELKVIEGRENPLIETKLCYGGICTFVELLRPWGHHLVAIDSSGDLTVVNSYDGLEIARLNIGFKGQILQFLSHPDYPLVAATSTEGEIALFGLCKPETPFEISKFYLQSERLDLLKFSQCGKYLVAGQRTTGICFVIRLFDEKPFAVMARLDTKYRMNDVLLYENHGNLKLFVLVVSSKRITVGRWLACYDVKVGRQSFSEANKYLELPHPYQLLHYAPKAENRIVATSYLSRQIHLLEIVDWEELNLARIMVSGHDVRRMRLFTSREFIVSTAFDGRVILRDGKSGKVLANLVSHHRHDLGVVKAITDATGDRVVALGYNGSLVGIRRRESLTLQENCPSNCRFDFREDETLKSEILSNYESLDPALVEILSKKVEGFPGLENDVTKTWTEWDNEMKDLEEAKKCSQAKIAIQNDVAKLRDKIFEFLNENANCPEIEKLPIAAFDLDIATRDSRQKAARDKREFERLKLEASCVSMDRIAHWIKSNLWDLQKTIGRSIFTISDGTEVTNYPTISDDPSSAQMLRLAQFFKDSMQVVVNAETFSPWKLYTPSKLALVLRASIRRDRVDEREQMNALLSVEEEEEERKTELEKIEDQLANEGTTSHCFIEPSERYYSQFEHYGFGQLLMNDRNLVDDCKSLRGHLNKLFDDIFSLKEHEMRMTRDRHERIRFIDSELRVMFGQSVANMPVDLEWHTKEKPDGIIRVLDREVETRVKPYVSESQQELLDREALEASRLRQLLLADDFKEKALMKMMDGVLEVRWEDIIKRDIGKPECMLTKKPDEYNAEDLVAVRQYEKDTEHLTAERRRYNKMLEAELTKIGTALRESTDKFNVRIHDFALLKMRIEAAIDELNLRRVRGFLRHVCRIKAFALNDEMRENIAATAIFVGVIRDHLRILHSASHEHEEQLKTLINREKTVDRKFRSEFSSLSRSNVAVLEQEYKRRPRTTLKHATASDFVELGRSAVLHAKIPHLSHECTEYLKMLANLDERPAALQGIIDDYHWEHLVRIRRNRIELEMRTRSQTAQVHENEKMMMEHEKKIVDLNVEMECFKARLNAIRQERIDFDLDMEVQLVLKMGQVEMPSSQVRDMMKNLLLIPRAEIEIVNDMIIKAGAEKLKSMNRMINFRRAIISKEWEHMRLKIKIRNLEDELHMVENVLVTRNMMEFLNINVGSSKNDKTPQQLEREVEAMKKNCVKRLDDWRTRLESIEEKIRSVMRENSRMDVKITRMNVDRWEHEGRRDIETESKQTEYHERILSLIVRRSKLVKKLLSEYSQVLALETEHELARLRKFPVFDAFTIFGDQPG